MGDNSAGFYAAVAWLPFRACVGIYSDGIENWNLQTLSTHEWHPYEGINAVI